FTVTFKTFEKEIPVYTSVCTIDQAMQQAGIANKEGYACSIPSGTILKGDTVAVIAITQKSKITRTEVIPCKYIEQKSASLYKGDSKISKKGENGSATVVYEITTVDGIEIGRTQISRTVTKEAVSGVKLIGTKKKPATVKKAAAVGAKTSASISTVSVLKPSSAIALDSKNRPVKYKSVKTVQATAYHQRIPSTATGMTARPGIVAVNPKVIPYYTKMWIVSTDGKYVYGYSIAADTGGFARKRPNNVDLYFASESQCEAFGRRNVNIYFL
ncbi:MAG: G5 domain-containing protein, partial [Oscillospiraceae bacterium]|nr:G5 domain-containing protein [Candidatus Equicaccousia limihippi]